ncbi:2-phospho-L-lactate guanylyltransferase [Actinocatenispora rupis]|uniref:Phosphoenolpyruvate guanylyltransferase n=1 Tax=Actinocatenispora rupis TaxID=519421 RepID=A0A8J3JED0_9ACTN|nr:2-phospho-L-lactate guanylyltransferase [Actinocatenispora rupis]GID14383.1 2-phospho-L-lactate guanylyltransferase [Actinocatenispora rupis]
MWSTVLPVKRLSAAKSRLRGALPGVAHHDLALAVTLDTVAAVLSCPLVDRLYLVTDEPLVTDAATRLGARVLPDRPDQGLNAAVGHGAAYALGRGARRVAALTADLPALRPDDLAAALAAAADRAAAGDARAYVADAEGTGTTLLAATGADLDPRFGPGSAAAHAATGAVPLGGGWPSLRRDVDTPADLATAAGLGLGPRTTVLLTARTA